MRKWINLIESMTDEFDGYLYHVAPAEQAESIAREGIRPVSYWAIGSVHDYYVEEVSESGEAKIYRVPLTDFDASLLEPDYPGLEEPLTYTLKMSEEEVWEEWESSEQTWRDCLDIIGSVRYRGSIVSEPEE